MPAFYLICAIVVILIFVGFSGSFKKIGEYFYNMWQYHKEDDEDLF